MSSHPQTNIFDRLLFLAYHIIILVITLFGLNYFSLSQPDVGQALQKMILFKNSEVSMEQKKLNLPSIVHLSGKVLIFEDEFSGSDRDAFQNDVLKSGQTIETKDGSVLISLGQDRAVSIRLLPGTIVKFDELRTLKAAKDISEHTLISLVQGQMITKSTLPKNIVVDVRTKKARFSLMNSSSAIATDNKNFYFLVVKEGSVRAENSATLKFDMVSKKHNFFINAEGRERRSELPEPLKFFEWDLSKVAPQEITEERILSATGGPLEVEVSEEIVDSKISEELQAELEVQVKKGILDFTEISNKLRTQIASEQVSFEDLKKRHEQEAMKVYADITCLETSRQCDLYSEKLLLSRGFGRLHNSSRLAAAIIKDLKAYLEEQANARAMKEKEVKALVDLEARRRETMTWVQSRLADKSRFKEILAKLSDQSLIP